MFQNKFYLYARLIKILVACLSTRVTWSPGGCELADGHLTSTEASHNVVVVD